MSIQKSVTKVQFILAKAETVFWCDLFSGVIFGAVFRWFQGAVKIESWHGSYLEVTG